MIVPTWLTYILLALVPFTFLIAKLAIKKYVERAIDASFERRLESVRSDLRVKETKISALQSSALSNRAGRDAIIEKRRIEALEKVWQFAIDLRQYKMSVLVFNVFKIDDLSTMADKNPKVRDMVETMSGLTQEKFDRLSGVGGDTERLFLPIDVWATFSALRSVFIYTSARLRMLAAGVENSQKLIDGKYVLNILKAVLPNRAEYIDENGFIGIGNLTDELDELLLSQLQQALRGEDADQASVERSAKVLQFVGAMETQVATNLPKN